MFVSKMIVGTKTSTIFSILGTKSIKMKKYGPKWKYGENVGTKKMHLPHYLKVSRVFWLFQEF